MWSDLFLTQLPCPGVGWEWDGPAVGFGPRTSRNFLACPKPPPGQAPHWAGCALCRQGRWGRPACTCAPP